MRLLLAFPLLLAATLQASPPSAEQVVAKARAQAGREGKNVLVYFRASWCPWCKRMEKLFADPGLKPVFSRSYVIAPITVRERDELRKTENAGWAALMRKLRGTEEQDVPYLAVLSPRGEKLGDSYRPPQGSIPGNAGFPRTYKEIQAFVRLIADTGKNMTKSDWRRFKEYFQAAAR